jgi:hypothetical protein
MQTINRFHGTDLQGQHKQIKFVCISPGNIEGEMIFSNEGANISST